MRLAALTMAYNEPVWAGVWSRFYAGQVGAANCFLLDHGSDDGSTEGLGIHVERLGRSALDEDARAATIGSVTRELLRGYDAVVHSDVDELVIADPRRHRDLAAYAAACTTAVVTSVGFDVQHLASEEPALVIGQAIGAQRRWVRFSAAMCKPCFVREPVAWSPGFHMSDAPMVMDGLFLLHLRYADLGLGLRRLERTRGLNFAHAEINPHQRVSDAAFAEMLEQIAQLPRESIAFEVAEGPLAAWVERTRAAQAAGGGDWLALAGDRLWELPEAFRRLF